MFKMTHTINTQKTTKHCGTLKLKNGTYSGTLDNTTYTINKQGVTTTTKTLTCQSIGVAVAIGDYRIATTTALRLVANLVSHDDPILGFRGWRLPSDDHALSTTRKTAL